MTEPRDESNPVAQETEGGELWTAYSGEADDLPDEWFLAIVKTKDEDGVPCESAPVLIYMDPPSGALFFGDGSRCVFSDYDILRWAPYVARSIAPSVDVEKIAEEIAGALGDDLVRALESQGWRVTRSDSRYWTEIITPILRRSLTGTGERRG